MSDTLSCYLKVISVFEMVQNVTVGCEEFPE